MISVYILDDHPLFVEGIVSYLQKEKNITIVGYSHTATDCMQYINTHTAIDILLLDINLPDGNGIDLCTTIKATYPAIGIIALSSHNQGSYIANMIEQGARGYLLKNTAPAEILAAIKAVHMGDTYYCFEVAKSYKLTQQQRNEQPTLSKREKEILLLIANGMPNSEISKQLYISIDTVDTHRKNLYHKLDVHNIASLIKKAKEMNYL